MLGGLLQGGGHAQKFLLRHTWGWAAVGDHRLALGEGARLVQHHGLDGVQGLQRLGGLDQDAVLRALAGAHHDGHGGGQSKGAGAGDDQHRHPGGEGLGHVPAGGDEPNSGGDDGNSDDHGDEYPRHLVGQFGDGGLGGGRLVHQTDHLGQRGVLPHPGGPEGKGAGLVDGGGGHLGAGQLLHGQALAGEGGLIHRGGPLGHHPVHRDATAGADHDEVAHRHVLHGYLYLRAVPQHHGGLGGQIHQAGDGLAGLALGAGLQPLAQGDQGEDHARGLKVEIHGPVFHLGQLGGRVARAIGRPAQVPGDEEQGRHAVEHRGRGAKGDERVHVGRAVPQGLEAHRIVFAVDIQDGQGEQELEEGHHQGVGRLVEEGGQGPAHHVPHGDVEQGRQKH